MHNLIYAVISSFIICLVIGPSTIKMLRRLKFGQTEREDGPKSHLKKQGTPTMGGVMILVAITITSLVFTVKTSDFMIAALLITLAYGLIGFVDDFIKVYYKRSLGLTPIQKIIGQVGIALIFAIYAYRNPYIGSKIIIPFINIDWNLGIWYIPFTVFVMVATVNSVNLTDGLDGLASGVTLIYAASFSIIFYYAAVAADKMGLLYYGINLKNMVVFAGAVTGACLGFLRFNAYPAKVIMGDTGSLALGGAVAVMAFIYKLPLIIPIMGGLYLIESLSVIIQVVSYKTTKKRVFKMAPIHHHFELCGIPETKIVSMFMIITTILCLVGLLTLK